MQKVRLNKYLASLGVASRRNIDRMISDRLIEINGQVISELGTKIDPKVDKIKVSGKEIEYSSPLVYIILNKPKGVVSTSSDEYGREAVTDLVDSSKRLYPVGRLDQDSRGLILLTNDGELTHKLTHPKFHIEKTYLVKVVGSVTEEVLDRLRNGIVLKDGKTAPAKVEIEGRGLTSKEVRPLKKTQLRFVIHEGRHRQIRRMCGVVNLEVLDLQRISIGPIELGDLKEGQSRDLTEIEINSLKRSTGDYR